MSLKSLNNQTYTNKSLYNSVNPTGRGPIAPVITSIIICDSNYTELDDTALSPAGSYVKLIGTGFKTGCTVYFNNESLTATFISGTEVRIQTPATTVGAYNIMLFNPTNEGGAIYLNLSVSSIPAFTTASGTLGSYYEANTISNTIVASGDTPLSYSLYSGSLPSGATLNSDGTITGTSPADSGSTTYSFVVNVKDAQGQDATRSFSLTINTDPVTWSTPSADQVITSYEYSPISNVTLLASSAAGKTITYTANSLPTGISLSGNTISGSNNTVGNTYTRLTATAATTGRTATRDITFNVAPDVVTWSSPANDTAYTLAGGSAISNVSLSATSAAGRTITYSANSLPSGVSLSGDIIYGTPDTAQTVYTLLTATADTTNRSATRTISWIISLGDTYWKNTTLLLNGVTSSNTFINDVSLNNNQLTVFGDARPNNFNPYTQGYYSFYAPTNASYYTYNDTTAFGTGDFTVEWWGYTNSASTNWIVNSGAASNWQIVTYLDGFYWQENGGNLASMGFVIEKNKWMHFAISRTGGYLNVYIDGVRKYNAVNTYNYSATGSRSIGQGAGGTSGTVWMSNLRTIKGTGIYSGTTITVPTGPLTSIANTALLTCQSNRMIDNGPNNYAFTPVSSPQIISAHPFVTPTNSSYNTQYSTYFDGTGDYITGASNSALAVGTNQFTLEFWIYFRTTSDTQEIFRTSTDTTTGRLAVWYNGTSLQITATGGAGSTSASYTFTAGQWYHVAATRDSSNNQRLFVNGALLATSTSTNNYLQNGFTLGAGQASGNVNGLVSNLRLIVGSALYTSAFTPPTSSLTAVSGTQLLICQDYTLKDNSTNNFAITSAGQAQPVALSPFTMTTSSTTVTSLGSAYFDGSGDYLSTPGTAAFGTGDFTIEGWVYATGSVVNNGIFQLAATVLPSSISGLGVAFFGTSSTWTWLYGGTQVSFGASPVANTWYYFTLCRSGTSLRFFLNGVLVGTVTDSTNYTQTALVLGGYYSTGNLMSGYISDFRILKGTAIYTSNFLPPQTPLTPVANTQLLTCQTNGAANNTSFVDQSSFNNVITRYGNTTQGTFSPYSQTGWSNYFNGSSYISTSTISNALIIGTSTFTVEFWVNHNVSGSSEQYFDSTLNGFSLSKNSSNQVVLSQAGVSVLLTTTGTVPINQWSHIAVVRNGTSVVIYINGSSAGTATLSTNFTNNDTFIGRQKEAATAYLSGYISNLRWIVGTAVYTSAFTPPTSPLTAIANTKLLTCQSPMFIDNSLSNYVLTLSGTPSTQAFSPFGGITSVTTSYSNYFDGSGDYFTLPSNQTQFSMSTGDFTIEMWVCVTSLAAARTLYDTMNSGDASGTNRFAIQISTGGVVQIFTGAGTIFTSGGTLSINTWYHIAYVKISNSGKLYVNGTQVNTTYTDNNTYTVGNTSRPIVGINAYDNSSNPMMGYISNLRVVKGTGIYTGAFTPSTTPLTAVSGTSLLTCQSNTIIDNSTNKFAITVVGDTKVKPFNPFGTTTTTNVSYSPSVNGGSMYFDGDGDYLTATNSSGFFNTTTNNWTVQGWYYWPTTRVTSTTPLLTGTNSAGTTKFGVYFADNNYIYVSDITTINIVALNTPMPIGQWTHIAVVNNSGTVKVYVNGTSVASVSNGLSSTDITTLVVGNLLTYSFFAHAWLSDVSLTKAALYTSNFYPPVAPITPTTTIGANTYGSTLYLTGTSAGITDAHGTHVIETTGTTQLAPQDPYGGSYYSYYFDGTGDYLQTPSSGQPTMTGDFTVSAWLYVNAYDSVNRSWIIDNYGATSTAAWGMAVGPTGGLQIWYDGFSSPKISGAANQIPLGVWTHVAFTRSGSTITSYVNGVAFATTGTKSTTFGSATIALSIGTYANGQLFNGYMSNLRILDGVVDTAVPTAPYTNISGVKLLTCQSNRLKDNSTNNYTLSRAGEVAVKSQNPFQQNPGKSLYFGTKTDYYGIKPHPSITTFTGDFTMECWVYPNENSLTATSWGIFDSRQSGASAAAIILTLDTYSSTGWLMSYYNGTQYKGTTRVPFNAWSHLAFVRSGSTMTFFVNGVAGGTATVTGTQTATATTNPIYIGSKDSGLTGYGTLGYIKDFRITNGIARYTTTFTPPTASLDVK